MPDTVRDIITDSLVELGAYDPGEAPSARLFEFALSRYNQIIDNWNAQREAVYAETFLEFTFIPGTQEYTIGPESADFTVAQRPVSVEGANVLLNNTSPTVKNPITMRDYQFWQNLVVQEVTTTFPTDCWYEANWPNGILHFWPKPTTDYGLQLTVRQVLSAVTVNTTFAMPPGYRNAIMLTLAEDLSPALGKDLSPVTMQKAREARNRIFINNDWTPTLQTFDSGMPSNGRNRSSFNYRTGLDMQTSR